MYDTTHPAMTATGATIYLHYSRSRIQPSSWWLPALTHSLTQPRNAPAVLFDIYIHMQKSNSHSHTQDQYVCTCTVHTYWVFVPVLSSINKHPKRTATGNAACVVLVKVFRPTDSIFTCDAFRMLGRIRSKDKLLFFFLKKKPKR